MNKLTKTQRQQLGIIAISTMVLMAGLWFFGVTAMDDQLVVTRQKTEQMRKKMKDAEVLMRRGDEIGDRLHAGNELLQKREAGLAPDRDTYAWIINTINPFIQNRKGVNIYSYSQPEISDVGLFSHFPYRWATFHIKGTGYYQDFGKFFADFENSFPYFRIQNLEISENAGPGMEAEKLNFNFDLVAPVTSGVPDTK